MPVGVAQAVGGQGIHVQRVDAPTLTAQVAVADVVKHDHQHIRLARSGARRQLPMWLRIQHMRQGIDKAEYWIPAGAVDDRRARQVKEEVPELCCRLF